MASEVCPVGTLIIGGLDRTISYAGFEDFLAGSDIENVICLPETGRKIAAALAAREDTKPAVYTAADMEEAVSLAVRHTRPGTACVLSPAAASYNVYKNFEEKGKHFKELVKEMCG